MYYTKFRKCCGALETYQRDDPTEAFIHYLIYFLYVAKKISRFFVIYPNEYAKNVKFAQFFDHVAWEFRERLPALAVMTQSNPPKVDTTRGRTQFHGLVRDVRGEVLSGLRYVVGEPFPGCPLRTPPYGSMWAMKIDNNSVFDAS